MRPNILKSKSFQFSQMVLEVSRELKKNSTNFSMINQLENSATGIGASIREGEFAQSRADFIHKYHIALKEANETEYWLKLFKSGKDQNDKKIEKLLQDLNEIIYLLIASIKTAKRNLKNY